MVRTFVGNRDIMELEDRKRLQKKFCLLVGNLEFSEIQDYLFQDEILDDEEIELVDSKPTKKGKIREFLKILSKKKGAFGPFCKVLRECEANYSGIADELENTEVVDGDEDLVDGSEISSEEKMKELMKQMWDQTQMMFEMKKLHHMEVAELQRRLSEISQAGSYSGIRDSKWVSSASVRPVEMDSADGRSFVKDFAEFMQRPSDNDRQGFSLTDVINYFSRQSQKEIEAIACHLGIDVTQYYLKRAGYDVKLKPLDKYSTVMRQMVEETLNKYGADLEACVAEMHKDELRGYFAIESLADELFEDDKVVNWGRIVSWYAFWVKCLISLPKLPVAKLSDFVEFYGRFIGFYVARRLHGWIAKEGGWISFVKWNAAGREISSNSILVNIVYVIRILLEHFPFRP